MIDSLRAVKGDVQGLLDKRDERKNQEEVCTDLDLMRVKGRLTAKQ